MCTNIYKGYRALNILNPSPIPLQRFSATKKSENVTTNNKRIKNHKRYECLESTIADELPANMFSGKYVLKTNNVLIVRNNV